MFLCLLCGLCAELILLFSYLKHAGALDCVVLEGDEGVVGLGKREGLDVRLDADPGGLFEEVTAVWPGYPEPGLRSARAILLALLNRLPEAHAALQIELNCFPDFAPAQSMLERLEAATATPA